MVATDILIIGGGIVGLSIARELNNRDSTLSITIVEKEEALARHASGRNSGVLHAGFYYTPDTLKARLTVDGNRLMTEYCLENHLSINKCGKVVVARNDHEIESLIELKRRGDKNGVALEIIDEHQLEELEPNAKTFQKALYSPTTSTVNPIEIVEHIGRELRSKKRINIQFNENFIKRESKSVIRTRTQTINFKYLISAAGLYADKVAHQFGVGLEYILIPFKGMYIEYKDNSLITKHIYPVPNLNNPFLGVHFTKGCNGEVKVGPTAIPALWRENYQGLQNFSIKEFLEVVSNETRLFYTNASCFRNLAYNEFRKIFRKHFISEASQLVKKVKRTEFGGYLKPGIRAQVLDRKKMELTMDFIVEHGENSMHVLNAVSPAFTCAFSFSRLIADEIIKRLN